VTSGRYYRALRADGDRVTEVLFGPALRAKGIESIEGLVTDPRLRLAQCLAEAQLLEAFIRRQQLEP